MTTMCNNAKLLLNWICLVLVVAQLVDGGVHGVTSRVRRDAKQGNGKKCPNRTDFLCKNGQCISEDQECDGIVDCVDESDESNSCHRIKCPSYLFRCGYGACINADRVCDGKPDCRDRSDETSPKCSNLTATDSCREDQFRCSSGQCISEDLRCDGKADCRDDSDEITATCWNIGCPRYTYRCKYGACVDGNAKCNGVVECFDGSDEDHCKEGGGTSESGSCTLPQHPQNGQWAVFGASPGAFLPSARVQGGTILTVACLRGFVLTGSSSVVCTNGTWSSGMGTCSESQIATPPPPVIESGSCLLPEHPSNGQWSVYKSSTVYVPGMSVNDGGILEIKCKRGYTLDGHNSVSCMNGTWSSIIGECLKTCPPRHSTPTLTVKCTYNGRTLPDCSNPIDGTLAKFNCAPFYEDQSFKKSTVQVCKDGSWNQQEPQCVPACGKKSTNPQLLIVNGTSASKGDYPWHVGLYRAEGRKFICGGSLVSQRVIVSAAHCVTHRDNGTLYPKEHYIVAVGKYYRTIDDVRDKNYVQESKLQHILIPSRYRGPIQNYVGDIAVLVTVKTFKLSLKVQPVCIDTGLNYNIPYGTTGYVAGWGFTKRSGAPSEELKELQVPLIQDTQCEASLDDEYDKYLTEDKLCAGHLDKGMGVCQGDSGGGLVTKYDGRYYLAGVVSLSPHTADEEGAGCDVNQYGLYTRVSQYIEWIFTNKETYLPS